MRCVFERDDVCTWRASGTLRAHDCTRRMLLALEGLIRVDASPRVHGHLCARYARANARVAWAMLEQVELVPAVPLRHDEVEVAIVIDTVRARCTSAMYERDASGITHARSRSLTPNPKWRVRGGAAHSAKANDCVSIAIAVICVPLTAVKTPFPSLWYNSLLACRLETIASRRPSPS